MQASIFSSIRILMIVLRTLVGPIHLSIKLAVLFHILLVISVNSAYLDFFFYLFFSFLDVIGVETFYYACDSEDTILGLDLKDFIKNSPYNVSFKKKVFFELFSNSFEDVEGLNPYNHTRESLYREELFKVRRSDIIRSSVEKYATDEHCEKAMYEHAANTHVDYAYASLFWSHISSTLLWPFTVIYVLVLSYQIYKRYFYLKDGLRSEYELESEIDPDMVFFTAVTKMHIKAFLIAISFGTFSLLLFMYFNDQIFLLVLGWTLRMICLLPFFDLTQSILFVISYVPDLLFTDLSLTPRVESILTSWRYPFDFLNIRISGKILNVDPRDIAAFDKTLLKYDHRTHDARIMLWKQSTIDANVKSFVRKKAVLLVLQFIILFILLYLIIYRELYKSYLSDRDRRTQQFIAYASVTSFDFFDFFVSFFTVEYLMLFFIFFLFAYGTVKHVSTDSVQLPKIHFFSLLIVLCTFFLCVFILSSQTYYLQSNLLDTSYLVHYDYNLIVECFLLFIGFLIFFFTYGYNKMMGVLSFEYYIIMLSCLCSFCVFVHANNLIFIYVLIELQSIASYILTSMNKHNRYSIEAGLKYFIIGSFSSILLLFGFSFVYGFSGFIYLSDLTSYVRYLYSIDDDFFLYCLLFSLILVNIGFLFKIYASPFHFWISDIYQGAPTSVTMFLSTIPVFSYFYMFSKFYVFIFSDFFSFYNYLLYFISILSMFSGVFGALIQRKIKKLIAYSSVSTIGYLLASLSGDNVLMVQQCLLYLAVYILNIVPIFIILLNYRINNQISIDNIRSFSSLYSQNKVVFFFLFTFFLSLAGVPPFSGFASKLSLFTALGSEGLFFLLFCGLTTAIISCYYYLRVAKLLFYDSHNTFFFFSTFTYSAAFTTGVFFFFNCLFLFYSYILDDISLYVSICLYLSV